MGCIWKSIKRFEDRYSVNEYAQIMNNKTGRILKSHTTRQGYERFKITVSRGGVSLSAHRAVAIAFIPNPENKPQVNHIDGNKLNNHVSNLEWVTNDENMAHAVATGLTKRAKDESKVSAIQQAYLLRQCSFAELARDFGVCRQWVSRNLKDIKLPNHFNLTGKGGYKGGRKGGRRKGVRITLACDICTKTFQVIPSRVERSKCCSKACHYTRQAQMMRIKNQEKQSV